jgi:hypothetical protein
MPRPSLVATHREEFQIFVDTIGTLNTKKTITLDVSSCDRIIQLRRQIEDKEGIPLDQMRLTFNGRPLEDHLIVATYNIQKESTIRVTGRLRGGAKRAKTSSSSEPIPTFLGRPEVNENDKPEVRAMFGLDVINIEALLGSMSQEKINELAQVVEKYENSGLSDTSVKAFSEFIQEMEQLKAMGARNGVDMVSKVVLEMGLTWFLKSF